MTSGYCLKCGKLHIDQKRKPLRQLDLECPACALRKRKEMERYALQRERNLRQEIDEFWQNPDRQKQAEENAKYLW